MAQVRFCDACQEPFPTTQIGSQQIQATTLRRLNGRYHSDTEQFDLCEKHAIGQSPVERATIEAAPTVVQGGGEQDGSDQS